MSIYDLTFKRRAPTFITWTSPVMLKSSFIHIYRCHRRNGPNFGRVFLVLNYTDITQNTYVQSLTVSEIMASEV